MLNVVRNIFRSFYYFRFGKSGKRVKINNEEYVVSAHVGRGIKDTINEIPLTLLLNLIAYVNPKTVFDVGANIGLMSVILAKKMKPGSVIYSFEPAPFSYKYLADTARVQKGVAKIIPVNFATGNTIEKLYFTNDGASCTNHISLETESGSVSIDSIPLDSFCEQNNIIPEVIKMDIEGAEYWALQGMKNTLKNNNCYILAEIHNDFLAANNITGEMFGELIDSIGYTVYDQIGEKLNSFDITKRSCVFLSKKPLPPQIFEGIVMNNTW